MELQELIERIERWKQRNSASQPPQSDESEAIAGVALEAEKNLDDFDEITGTKEIAKELGGDDAYEPVSYSEPIGTVEVFADEIEDIEK